jgi:hypothetical protein
MKAGFAYLEANYYVIKKLCDKKSDFDDTWYNFVTGNGWTLEEYEDELERQVLGKK